MDMMAEKRVGGTSRAFVAVMAVLTAVMLAMPAAAFALPSETPDNTPMVEGRVRAIEQVGDNVWLGGRFDQVARRMAQSWTPIRATWRCLRLADKRERPMSR